MFGHLSERGWMPFFKLFEKLLFLNLDFFQEEGGYLIQKMVRNFFSALAPVFPRKMWEDNKNSITLMNFNPYYLRF